MKRTLFNAKTVEDVEFCLNRGDNIEKRMSFPPIDDTPFIHHCQKGNIEVVIALINKGCDVTIRNGSDSNGLDNVCEDGHYDLLVELLKFPQIKGLINPIGEDSPLFHCCRRGHCDIFEVLVENGADVNHKGEYEFFPLKLAMYYNEPCLVRKLLDNGADVTDVDEDNNTCIHIHNITLECLDIVLCYGGLALINKQNNKGETPLHIAIVSENVNIIPRLLECGANLNIGNYKGIIPLEYAKSCVNNELYDDDKIKAIINLLKCRT